MTNFGKCETCRRRKVKCDEVYPRCGACSKKNRDCYYANARDSIFVHEHLDLAQLAISSTPSLLLAAETWQECRGEHLGPHERAKKPSALHFKRFRKVQKGRGPPSRSVYNTRISESTTSLTSNSVTPALLCPQTTTLATWGSIFGFEALQLNPLGEWVHSAWLSAGKDAFLDLACDYVLQSMHAFRSKDERTSTRACVAGSKALRSLQTAFATPRKDSGLQNLVTAVMLHCAAEQFVDMGTNYYIPHVLGLSAMLKKCVDRGVCSDVIYSIASLITMDEVNVSVLWGGPSALENMPRPETPSEGPYVIGTATSAVESLLVQLPRLACLVRLIAQHPNRIKYKLDAIARIGELYNSNRELYIQQTLDIHSKVVETSEEESRCRCKTRFEVHSLNAFALAIRYYFYRVVLCGLMQALHDLEPQALSYDMNEIYTQDIAAASSIGMCLDYALSTDAAIPITALGMIIPLQLSFGTWHRLLLRQAIGSADHQQALRMKDWTIENVNYLEVIWNGRLTRPKRMQKVCEVFAGGPLLEHTYDYKRCDSAKDGVAVYGLDHARPKLDWIAPAKAYVNEDGLVDIVH